MLPLMSKLAASILIGATSLTNPTNPTTPRALSFEASVFVTVTNQIRLAVEKTTNIPVTILLRNKDHQVLYRQTINPKEAKYAVKLDVDELADGQYELVIKSSEGSLRKQLNLSNQQPKRIISIQ